jgi:hypothetical protein
MNPETRAGTQKPRKGVPYKFKGNGNCERAGETPALRLQQQIPRQPKCGFLGMRILTDFFLSGFASTNPETLIRSGR